ncbi:hypothetical protein ACLB2K_000851 [Fragaria x ananassa]
MAPEIIDLTVDSPPSSPTHPHHPNNPSSSSTASSAAAAMPNYPPRCRAGRPRSNYCYKRFIRTNQVKQQSLAVRPTPATACPSRLRYHNNVHRYSAGTQTMRQGGQSLPVSDALWTQKEHDQFVEGVSKCGMGNWTGIAIWFVKTKSREQVRKYAEDYFMRVRSTATRATRYIQKDPSSVGPSDNNDINVAPRAKNPASRHLRRLISKGLGGLRNPRSNNMVHQSSGGPVLLRGPESAPGQQLVTVSAPSFVSIPVFPAPSAVPVSVSVPDTVLLLSSWRKPPYMFSRFPAEGPVLLPPAEGESSCSSSGRGDHGDGEADAENEINLELTLG